jgi:CheY-like chemotaxis protein
MINVDDSAHHLKVLVIDDRAEVARAIAEMCETLGVSADISHDGEVVRDMLTRSQPSGVIIDVIMPDEDGYEALKVVAEFNRNLPVLLISGHGLTWLRVGASLARAYGLSHVITGSKPIPMAMLADFVGKIRSEAPNTQL